MDQIGAILVLAALIAVVYLIRKAKNKVDNAVGTAVNKNVLFRSEFKEGQELVSTSYTFQSSASVEDILRSLDKHVEAAESVGNLVGTVYISNRNADSIHYSFGNKLMNKSFDSVIRLKKNGEETQGVFKVLQWYEHEGMVAGLDQLRNLRKQIKEAILSADPNCKVTETQNQPSQTN